MTSLSANMDQSGLPHGAPTGTLQARVGANGRLKLPAAIYKYLLRMDQERVFITSLDRKTVRIYPLSEWRRNQDFFGEFRDDPQAVEDIAFIANHLGRDSDVDDQGRVMIPAELRREIAIEDQPVWLNVHKGHISVYTQAVYEERLRRASEGLQEKLMTLERAGLR